MSDVNAHLNTKFHKLPLRSLRLSIKMAEEKPDPARIRAKEKLEHCRDEIVDSKPSSTNRDYVNCMLHPSDQKDLQYIRYFKRVSHAVSFVSTGQQLKSKNFKAVRRMYSPCKTERFSLGCIRLLTEISCSLS